jgi:hypothetical protein
MRNYKINIDLTDIFKDLQQYKLKEYPMPYITLFIEADNPDDACHELITRIISDILKRDKSINTRVFCRKIRRIIRFDKILSL